MADTALIAELAQLRTRAEAACEEARHLRHKQRAILKSVRARLWKARAVEDELRQFLRQATNGGS